MLLHHEINSVFPQGHNKCVPIDLVADVTWRKGSWDSSRKDKVLCFMFWDVLFLTSVYSFIGLSIGLMITRKSFEDPPPLLGILWMDKWNIPSDSISLAWHTSSLITTEMGEWS